MSSSQGTAMIVESPWEPLKRRASKELSAGQWHGAGRPWAEWSCRTNIYYWDKYDDEELEYWHVMLPKDIAKLVPKAHLMSESEWRNLGVQQSQGWVHYMIHEPEPHILLYWQPLPKKPKK
ncbi:cyclin-dependent kinases regulatory subunit 1-like [Arvicola amphibius]|uniref:cyclin-dependent kinases regulatory subunit 1-like n=1 Tax=Arvicola amphibius TaxID=1047088 RepID=UPI0018E3F71E|nr:cyclin-dependent kinases regulatory subunit 1-like [Arvicola amphibius]